MSDSEKHVTPTESERALSSEETLYDPDAGLSEEEKKKMVSLDPPAVCLYMLTWLQERKLLRKLDMKLIPWVSF
jgi:hypothetical protein